MIVPFNDLSRLFQRHAPHIEEAVLGALRSGWWLNGKRAAEFAQRFASASGTKHCIPVANGTDALELSMRAAASRSHDRCEVISVANAGGYSSTAVLAAGLRPVYADIELGTQLISAASVLECVSERTLAVVATHLYGNVVDIAALRRALDGVGRQDIFIIEDCAQSHGATSRGRPVGSMGDLAAFSFYPTKNLGAAGDAGAVVTSSDDFASTVQSLQQYGWKSKYNITLSGGRNSRMDEIQAAVLSVLLEFLDRSNAEREAILAQYRAAASPSVQFVERNVGSVTHLAVVICEDRAALQRHLRDRHIATEVHYPILDCDQVGWAKADSRVAPGGLPMSAKATNEILSLPCFVGMTTGEIAHVAKALGEFG